MSNNTDPHNGDPHDRDTAYAYSVAPLQQNQLRQYSTGTDQQVQIGLSASGGQVPGIKDVASGGISHKRAGNRKQQGIEDIPLVVGFLKSLISNGGVRGFGWIFGPSLDKLGNLRQRSASHSVSADLSVPIWWPRIELQVDYAWADSPGELHDMFRRCSGSRHSYCVKRNFKTELMMDKLPQGEQGLDVLTERIRRSHKLKIVRTARIFQVHPQAIDKCKSEFTLLVTGTELWRSPVAYLDGRKLPKYQVLPDMSGIALTFDPGSFLDGQRQKALLQIVTMFGKTETSIGVIGATPCKDTSK